MAVMMPANPFYNDFDREYYVDAENPKRNSDYRSPFQQDRDRIMFTSAFRRLQGKTQVFQAGEYDFYRTRLTHSLEVANIARSICSWLAANPAGNPDGHRLDTDLVEAICLAHDIGHPPFGHHGERVLDEWMKERGGFEGNAQSLRILTRTIYQSRDKLRGMTPSRALLDGVLKYKRLFADRGDDHNHFVYDEQNHFLTFCLGEGWRPALGPEVDVNAFRSVECQVMDLADDIAYSTCDLIDGVKARFITADRLQKMGEDATLTEHQRASLEKLAKRITESRLEASISLVIGNFINAAKLVETRNFLSAKTNRYRYNIELEAKFQEEIALYKRICRTLVFGSSELHQLEFKGGEILRKVLNVIGDAYLVAKTPGRTRLLPGAVHDFVLAQPDLNARARAICDHVASMTDSHAIRTYRRLFDPTYGSITELIEFT